MTLQVGESDKLEKNVFRRWMTVISAATGFKTADQQPVIFQKLQNDLRDSLIRSITPYSDMSDKIVDRILDDVLYKRVPSKACAVTTTLSLTSEEQGHKGFTDDSENSVKSIALIPATGVVLEHLDWFISRFETVIIGDNFKSGQVHHGIKVQPVNDVLKLEQQIDRFFVTTDRPEIEQQFLDLVPKAKTVRIDDIRRWSVDYWRTIADIGTKRVDAILQEIESSDNPIVVLGRKLLATSEPIFCALDDTGYDVFVVSEFDKMESPFHSGYDNLSPISRNVLLPFAEILYLLTHLKKGKFFVYYDFFHNVSWDVNRAIAAYGFTSAILKLASRPVILGMYDNIKPIWENFEHVELMQELYKEMIASADAICLTNKTDRWAEYLRNTFAKNKSVKSFLRYSFPPNTNIQRLSDIDGERHIVAVTSFLGETFEPNRIKTRETIQSVIQQGIHFHYYSQNEKVFKFFDGLSDEEKRFFHIEMPIWEQSDLIKAMSQYDAGWLVGDEATVFAKIVTQLDDRHFREIYAQFIPHDVPTSSMAYGAAGLPVFISRIFTDMPSLYPDGCCIPLDMGEVPNLKAVMERIDWIKLHKTMNENKAMFDVRKHIPDLERFLDTI